MPLCYQWEIILVTDRLCLILTKSSFKPLKYILVKKVKERTTEQANGIDKYISNVKILQKPNKFCSIQFDYFGNIINICPSNVANSCESISTDS